MWNFDKHRAGVGIFFVWYSRSQVCADINPREMSKKLICFPYVINLLLQSQNPFYWEPTVGFPHLAARLFKPQPHSWKRRLL